MLRLGSFLRHRHKSARQEDKPAPAVAAEKPGPAAETVPAVIAETTFAPSGVSKWREFITRLLAEDGYVIQASSEEMETGASVRMWGSDQPFRVIGGADYRHALRQWRIYRELSGEEMEPPPPPKAHWHYYKFGPARAGTK
jgi:hypothetical protein